VRALHERLERRAKSRFDVLGVGEISVDEVLVLDEVPEWGGKAEAQRWERLGGGQVATAMVAARRLGLATALVGAVGDDDAGRFALDGLREEGVDVTGVARVARTVTHRAVILVDGRGDRTVLYHDGTARPGLDLGAAHDRVRESRVLHVDGGALGPAAELALAAHDEGLLVSCDLDGYQGNATDALLASVDLCIVSGDFARAFAAGADDETLLAELARRLAPGGVACVTLGAGGALLFDGERIHTEEAHPAEPLVDTTACGDTFRAAFLAALLDGWSAHGCLRWGCAAAALKARDLGRRGCPTRAEVEQRVAARMSAAGIAGV
jgi:sugar/nucleoside kinase (ribokinase family)